MTSPSLTPEQIEALRARLREYSLDQDMRPEDTTEWQAAAAIDTLTADLLSTRTRLEEAAGQKLQAEFNAMAAENVLAAARRTITRLEGELAEIRRVGDIKNKIHADAFADADTLAAENARLREALKPFADRYAYFARTANAAGKPWPDDTRYCDFDMDDDGNEMPGADGIYLGQLRLAQAALSVPSQEGGT